MCCVKFKENNQSCLPLKINKSINANSAYDRNNKSMYSCFYESKKFLSCLMYWEEKKQDSENVFFVNMEKLFMADLLPNGLYEKVMICSICCITKSRLDVQFVKKIPLEKFNKWKKRGMTKINNGFYIKCSIHLLLK